MPMRSMVVWNFELEWLWAHSSASRTFAQATQGRSANALWAKPSDLTDVLLARHNRSP